GCRPAERRLTLQNLLDRSSQRLLSWLNLSHISVTRSRAMSSPSDFQKQPNPPPIETFQKNPGGPNAPQPVTGYQPPALGDLSKPGGAQLGSLAQSARDKQLGRAKGWLIFLGIMTIVVTLFQVFILLPNEIDKHIQSEIGAAKVRGMQLTNLEEMRTAMYVFGYIISAAVLLLGVVYIVLGCFVRSYPLPATITAMILFIVSEILAAVLDPVNIGRGFILKIIIFVVLVKAIGAAAAYEKEKRKNLAWETPP